jgi:2-amino-4-hydroxy-6-hydroxymethyldihydropteridine diphosphokinase
MNREVKLRTAYVGLGSNLGDRQDYLDRALQMFRSQPGIVVAKVSSSYETVPVGGSPGQPNYLNAVAELRSVLEPRELLQMLLDVEQSLGRIRRERNGPRTIDLDLLLFDDLIRQDPDLTIPHPRMHDREFVLRPLSEIAPQATHPVMRVSILELLNHLPGISSQIVTASAIGGELASLRAVVTGSTSGIGQVVAHELATSGARVIIHGRRLREKQATDDQQNLAPHSRSRLLLADLSNAEECQRLVQEAWAEWSGYLDQ